MTKVTINIASGLAETHLKQGQYFIKRDYNGENMLFVIAQVGDNQYCLVCLGDDANRWVNIVDNIENVFGDNRDEFTHVSSITITCNA